MRVFVVVFAFLFGVQCAFANDSYTKDSYREDSYSEDSYMENPYMQDLEEDNQSFEVRRKEIFEKIEKGFDEFIQEKHTDTLSSGLQELVNAALDEGVKENKFQYKKATCSGTNDIICEITELTFGDLEESEIEQRGNALPPRYINDSIDRFSYNITFRFNATNPKKVQFTLKIKESGKSHINDKNIAFIIPRLYEWNMTLQYTKGLVAFIDTHRLRANGYTMNLNSKSDMKNTLFGDNFFTTLATLKDNEGRNGFLRFADASRNFDKALDRNFDKALESKDMSKDMQYKKELLQNDVRIHSMQWSASGELMESLCRLYGIFFNENDEIDSLQRLREYEIEKLMATKANIDDIFERAKSKVRNMGVKPTSLSAWQDIFHNAIDSMRNILSQKESAITLAITAKQKPPLFYATFFEWYDKLKGINSMPYSPDKDKRQAQYIMDLLQFLLDTYHFRIDNKVR